MMTNFHLMRKKFSFHVATFALTLHSISVGLVVVVHLIELVKPSEISASIQILGKPIASILNQNLKMILNLKQGLTLQMKVLNRNLIQMPNKT